MMYEKRGNNVVEIKRWLDVLDEKAVPEFEFDHNQDDFVAIDTVLLEELKAELLETSTEELPFGMRQYSKSEWKLYNFRMEVRGDIEYYGTTRYLQKLDWLPDSYINVLFEELERADEISPRDKKAYVAHI